HLRTERVERSGSGRRDGARAGGADRRATASYRHSRSRAARAAPDVARGPRTRGSNVPGMSRPPGSHWAMDRRLARADRRVVLPVDPSRWSPTPVSLPLSAAPRFRNRSPRRSMAAVAGAGLAVVLTLGMAPAAAGAVVGPVTAAAEAT